MAKYKFKLNEMSKSASPEQAEKELGTPKEKFEIGQVTISDDGQRKSTIYKIDPVTGQIGWKIEQLPGYDLLYDELDELVNVAKRVYVKTKDDDKFRDFYGQDAVSGRGVILPAYDPAVFELKNPYDNVKGIVR